MYPELISLAVHELRTPANVVWGYLRMLQSAEGTIGERERRMIDEATRSCERLLALVEELSDVGRLDDGRLAMTKTPVDLFPLVADAVGDVREGGDRGIRVEATGTASGAVLDGDAHHLRRALTAVFRSVAREQPGPCTIAVERVVKRSSGATEAIVTVGAQASSASAQAGAGAFNDLRAGLGLALPIARRVIEAHGGRVNSSAAGTQVSFPIAG